MIQLETYGKKGLIKRLFHINSKPTEYECFMIGFGFAKDFKVYN